MSFIARLIGAGSLVGCFATVASAQQIIPPTLTEFTDSAGTRLPSSVGAARRLETQYTDSVGGIVRVYSIDGKLSSLATYEHVRKGLLHGIMETWHENGQLQYHAEFEHGKSTGELQLYYANGQLKRREKYTSDFESAGECFAADGRPIPYFKYETLPVYPEGNGSTNAVIYAVAHGVKYPPDAKKAGKSGRVVVSFNVAKDGRVVDIRLVQGLFPSVDAEVIRAVGTLKPFKPGTRDGEPISVAYTLPVSFALE